MEFGQDQFNPRHPLLRVDVHGHSPPIVGHFDGAVVVHGHRDLAGMTGQRLIHAVVDDFHRKVVWPGRVGVHSRPSFDRFKSSQDFDVFCAIFVAHLAKDVHLFTNGFQVASAYRTICFQNFTNKSALIWHQKEHRILAWHL